MTHLEMASKPAAGSALFLEADFYFFIGAIGVASGVVWLLGVVVWASFVQGLPSVSPAFTLENYQEVFLSPVTYRATANSLIVAFGTVAVNLFFAVPIAWLVHKTDMPMGNVVPILMTLGIIIPTFLKAIGWILLLSPKIGLINSFLQIFVTTAEGPLSIYNLAGIAYVQGLIFVPVMFFMISAAFRAIDPQLEESAEAAGAGRFRILIGITLPLLAPALIAACLYNFVLAMANFEVPALLAAPTQIQLLSVVMFYSIHAGLGLPRYGLAGVYGIVLLIPTLIVLYYYQRLIRHSYRYATVTGKPQAIKKIQLGSWGYGAWLFVSVYFALAILFPFLVLVWTSLLPYIQLPSAKAFSLVSIQAYRDMLTLLSADSVINTLSLVLSVPVLVLLSSFVISWVVLRTHWPGRNLLDTASMLPHATPSLAFAFAIFFLTIAFGKIVPIYGTIYPIILANAVAYISFGTRTLHSALLQIHRELEEAGECCGASKLRVIGQIVLPLLSPALFYGAVWVALLSFREVTMALFLQSPSNRVMSVDIWTLWQAGLSREASALGVFMVITTMAVMSILYKAAQSTLYGLRDT